MYMMYNSKLARLLERQRRRQIAALLAVSSLEEQERIKAAQKDGKDLRRKVEKL